MPKAAVSNTARYADLRSHPAAVYRFINVDHIFNYNYATFRRRSQSMRMMRPFIMAHTIKI